MDFENPWQKIITIIYEILKKAPNAIAHSGISWAGLVSRFQQIAKTGVPDRFLVKNEKFWVLGYYMPDFFPQILFVAGAGAIVGAFKYKAA